MAGSELSERSFEAGIGTEEDLVRARGTEFAQVTGFGVFLRSLVGPDRAAAQGAFAEFVAEGASADQIEFVGLVIEQLTRNGVMEPGKLYDSPFTDRSGDGPHAVFGEAEVTRLMDRIRAVNRSAVGEEAAAG